MASGRGLGQTELLAPARTKKVQVAGGGSWWGIDPSTLRVAITSVSAEGQRGVSTRSFPPRTGGRRLAVILYETRALARALIEAEGPPGVVVVEQPSGKTPNLPFVYAVAVIIAAVAEAAPLAVVDTVPSSTWKKVACGAGNLYKPKGRNVGFLDYGVAAWAREQGYRGSSWDEADSWGIADYAWRTYAIEAL